MIVDLLYYFSINWILKDTNLKIKNKSNNDKLMNVTIMEKNQDKELSRLITSLSKEVDVIPSESKKISAFKLAKRRLNHRERQIHKTGYGMGPKADEKNHDKGNDKRTECTDTESDSENSSVDGEKDFFAKAWENETNEKTESQITNREWLESEINSFCNAIDRQLGKPINVSNSNNIIYPNTSRVNLEESLDSKNPIRFSSNNKTQEGVDKSLAEQQVGHNGFIGKTGKLQFVEIYNQVKATWRKQEFPRQKKIFIKQLKGIFDKEKGKEALIEKIMDKSSIEKLKNHSGINYNTFYSLYNINSILSPHHTGNWLKTIPMYLIVELYKINFMSLLERYNQVKRAHSMVVPRMQMVEIQNKILFEIISKIYSDDEHNLYLLKEFIGKRKSQENFQKSSRFASTR
ncbi:uncharacterized protein TA07245 [Theileria annulata]|uniref:Uncharacterized protein n=1 Tax=Theileria annulata TaxID=5874 RepID=Q4UA94_THEAN|nr:uncharacterized protein TA07245 [Theileria annulata]CAI76259.1 hypothetical protein TA07245 [Theileria annulata]|eukprot:XP_952883.1 hypothetical protein TA07245 [Theileria annulata]